MKFIFATTEIRKVPVTVLSRCQRFDLRRVDAETLSRHFADDRRPKARRSRRARSALIARAADGSVRDGLSLLDQAIARADRRDRRSRCARHAGPGRPRAGVRSVRTADARRRQGGARSSRRHVCGRRRSVGRDAGPAGAHALADAGEAGAHGRRGAGRARGRARPRQGDGGEAVDRPCWPAPGRCC